jgi:hypothetical protein
MIAVGWLPCTQRAEGRADGSFVFWWATVGWRAVARVGVALWCSVGFVGGLRYGQGVGTAWTGRGWRVGTPGADVLGADVPGLDVLSAGRDLVADRAAR